MSRSITTVALSWECSWDVSWNEQNALSGLHHLHAQLVTWQWHRDGYLPDSFAHLVPHDWFIFGVSQPAVIWLLWSWCSLFATLATCCADPFFQAGNLPYQRRLVTCRYRCDSSLIATGHSYQKAELHCREKLIKIAGVFSVGVLVMLEIRPSCSVNCYPLGLATAICILCFRRADAASLDMCDHMVHYLCHLSVWLLLVSWAKL